MSSTNKYGEPLCLSLLNQLESKKRHLIIVVEESEGVYSCIMRWKKASIHLSFIYIYIDIYDIFKDISIC